MHPNPSCETVESVGHAHAHSPSELMIETPPSHLSQFLYPFEQVPSSTEGHMLDDLELPLDDLELPFPFWVDNDDLPLRWRFCSRTLCVEQCDVWLVR